MNPGVITNAQAPRAMAEQAPVCWKPTGPSRVRSASRLLTFVRSGMLALSLGLPGFASSAPTLAIGKSTSHPCTVRPVGPFGEGQLLYTIALADTVRCTLDVVVSLAGLRCDSDTLVLRHAGIPTASFHILSALQGAKRAQLATRDSSNWALAAGTRETTKLHYRITLPTASSPLHRLGFRPVDALIFPANAEFSSVRVRFRLPPGWSMILGWTATGPPLRVQSERALVIQANELFLPETHIYLGRWRFSRFQLRAVPVEIAVHPALLAQSDSLLARLQQAMAGVQDLMSVRLTRPAIVILDNGTTVPEGETCYPIVWISCRPELARLFPDELMLVAAHEWAHLLTPGEWIGPRSNWFLEGMAEYIALRTQVAAGELDWEEFGIRLGRAARGYDLSPLKGVSLVRAGELGANGSQAACEYVHDGGLLVVAYLEVLLQERHSSFVQFLRRLERTSAELRGTEQFNTLFWGCLTDLLGSDGATQIQRAVEIRFVPEVSFRQHGIVVAQPSIVDELEFRARLHGTTVCSFSAGSPAYLLGLRRGDRLIDVNGVTVTGQAQAETAWRHPVANGIRVTVERGGQRFVLIRGVVGLCAYTFTQPRFCSNYAIPRGQGQELRGHIGRKPHGHDVRAAVKQSADANVEPGILSPHAVAVNRPARVGDVGDFMLRAPAPS